MKYGVYVTAALATAAFVVCGHYGVNSYFKARQLQARSETLAVRTRLMKHQVGELEQKVRTLQRVEHFVDSAKAQGVTPEDWTVYDVQVQEAMAYQELAKIVEQCAHNQGLYFKPVSFHVAVGFDPDATEAEENTSEPVPQVTSGASSDGSNDVALSLQGAFLVRHR